MGMVEIGENIYVIFVPFPPYSIYCNFLSNILVLEGKFFHSIDFLPHIQ